MKHYNPILTIAGCDPSGGAGILADLKTFAAHKSYGLSVVTVLTAQNTVGVQGIHAPNASFVEQQLDSVLSDITPKATKIGMLFNEEIIISVAKKLQQYNVKNIVLDPVMVASSGDVLLKEDAIYALKKYLLPLADLVTPNIPEAKILAGVDGSKKEMALKIHSLGAPNILVKGGHDNANICEDLLLLDQQEITTQNPKINTKNTHGTGCTLSAAISCFLGQGHDLESAYRNARKYLQLAITSGANYQLGKGRGPVDHMCNY